MLPRQAGTVRDNRAEESERTPQMAAPSQTSRNRSTSRHAAWQALADHYETMRGLQLRDLFADDPARGERMTAEAAGVYLDYSKNRVNAETLKLLSRACPASRAARPDRRDVSAATRSMSRKIVPCCTWRCGRRKGASIIVDGKNVVPDVHAVLDQDGRLRQPRPQRPMERPQRQTHPQYRQYRHRRLRSRTGDGI